MNLSNPEVECQPDAQDNFGRLSADDRNNIEVDNINQFNYDSTENLKISEKDVNKAQVEV